MTHDELEIPRFSNDAIAILGHLKRHGGTMRIGPMFRRAGLEGEAFLDALDELYRRRWVRVTWRKPGVAIPPGLPESCSAIERITMSRFARWRYAVTWPTLP
jgi:hypothetical protein